MPCTPTSKIRWPRVSRCLQVFRQVQMLSSLLAVLFRYSVVSTKRVRSNPIQAHTLARSLAVLNKTKLPPVTAVRNAHASNALHPSSSAAACASRFPVRVVPPATLSYGTLKCLARGSRIDMAEYGSDTSPMSQCSLTSRGFSLAWRAHGVIRSCDRVL